MSTYSFYITTHRPNGSIVRTEEYTVQAESKEHAQSLAQEYVYNPYVHVHQTCSECKKVEPCTPA